MDIVTIIKDCLAGKALAYRQLYEQFSSTMFRTCLRYASSHEEAEDWLQEGFTSAFKALPNYQHQGNFEGWLRRIIIRTSIDQLRKNRLRTIELSEQALSNVPDNFTQNDLNSNEVLDSEQVLNAVQRLPEHYRTVFNLFVVEGYSHQEIAVIMNIAESSSRALMTRARAMLRKQFSIAVAIVA